jgi:hypothetical protein
VNNKFRNIREDFANEAEREEIIVIVNSNQNNDRSTSRSRFEISEFESSSRAITQLSEDQMNSLNCYNCEKLDHFFRNCRQSRKINSNSFVREMNVHEKNDSSSQKNNLEIESKRIISATVAAEIDEMKIVKIDVCNFEDTLFDDKLIIVDCILDLKDEYKIKAMIDNECIDYSFIDTDIAHKVCELLRIESLQLNKSREVKNYDERRNKNIIHVIYSFMTIQDHLESCTSMMIIKIDQHSIILNKF